MDVQTFVDRVLKGQTPPADLQRLLELEATRTGLPGEDTDPLAATFFVWLDPDQPPALISHAYLNDADRANPDTMANIAAFDEVFRYSTFVAVNDDGDPLGYWHGPEGTPLAEAAIMKLDSEGQFSLLQGQNISEAMLLQRVSISGDAAEFNRLRQLFIAHGIEIVATSLETASERPAQSHPSDVHLAAYNRFRVAAGLPPSP